MGHTVPIQGEMLLDSTPQVHSLHAHVPTNTNSDAVYPDPSLGGYKGKKDCGTFKPSSVISISYAYDEAGLPASYMNRQCNE